MVQFEWMDHFYSLTIIWPGLGLFVEPEQELIGGFGEHRRLMVAHTGGAVGCSSILLLLPASPHTSNFSSSGERVVLSHLHMQAHATHKAMYHRGIVVSAIVNMHGANLELTARRIAIAFEEALIRGEKVSE